jgi:hypothetical protein
MTPPDHLTNPKPDPDRHRRIRRRALPDVRSRTVREAFRRFRPSGAHEPDSRERDTLEPPVRNRLRGT